MLTCTGRTHTEKLRLRTHRVLYERFRKEALQKMGFQDDPTSEPTRCACVLISAERKER
jgi:hypothetical protein